MAFENLVAVNRGPGINHPDIAGARARGIESGQRNRLVAEQAAREEQFRNILAESVGPMAASAVQPGNLLAPGSAGISPEVMQQLMAVDPERATNLLAQQQQIGQVQQQQRVEQSREALSRMEYVLQSDSPAEALRLAGRMPNGADLIERMIAIGEIDSSDGIDDDEARRLAEMAVMSLTPIVGQANEARVSAAIGDMQQLGYPMTSEGFKQYNEDKGGEESEFSDLIQLRLLEIEGSRAEREERQAVEAEEEQDRQSRRAVREGLMLAEEVGQTATQLEGSLMAPGVPMSSLTRSVAGGAATLGALAGFDTEKLANDVAAYDSLKKNMARQVNTLIASGRLGEATNAKLDQAKSSLANEELSPAAIRPIQADLIEAYLEDAEALGMEIPEEERLNYEFLVESYRSKGAQSDDTVVDVPGMTESARQTVRDIGQMSVEQLNGLQERLSEFSGADRRAILEAAADRWDELNGG